MSLLDLIIGAIFLISIIIGLMRGFIKEVLSLISWILAFWLAYSYCVEVGDWLNQHIDLGSSAIRKSAGFGVIFVGTLFAFALIAYAVTKLLVRGPIKGVDRVLGIATGVARALAISAVILVLMESLGIHASKFWQDSILVPKLQPVVQFTKEVLPRMWQSKEPIQEGQLKDKLLEKGLESIKTGQNQQQ